MNKGLFALTLRLRFSGLADNRVRVSDFIRKESTNLSGIRSILKAIKSAPENERASILRSFVINTRHVLSLERVLNVMHEAHIDRTLSRRDLLINFISNKSQPRLTLENIIDILNNKNNLIIGDVKYDPAAVCLIYEALRKRDSSDQINKNVVEDLKFIADQIYDNSATKSLFFKSAIKQKLITEQNINEFFSSQNDEVFDMVAYAFQQGMQISPEKILNLIKGKNYYSKYDSLREDLQIPADQCLTAEGIDKLKSDLKIDDFSSLTIGDLVSFYDISNKKLSELSNFFTEEFATRIQENFVPQNIWLGLDDIKKIDLLFIKSKRSIRNSFINGDIFCDYFRQVLPSFGELSESERRSFNIEFADDEMAITKNNRGKINKAFRQALLDPRNSDKVIKFFSLMMNDGNKLINASNESKILNVWQSSKNKILYLCTQKGGIDSLALNCHSLLDGCAANLGVQVNLAIYRTWLKDPSAAILYQVFEPVVQSILNNNGVDNNDIIGAESDPFDNEKVHKTPIALDVLTREISRTFYDEHRENKIGINAWDFIEKSYEEFEESGAIKSKIAEIISYNDREASDIAAYLVLKNTIGEIKAGKSKMGVKAKNNLDIAIAELEIEQEGHDYLSVKLETNPLKDDLEWRKGELLNIIKKAQENPDSEEAKILSEIEYLFDVPSGLDVARAVEDKWRDIENKITSGVEKNIHELVEKDFGEKLQHDHHESDSDNYHGVELSAAFCLVCGTKKRYGKLRSLVSMFNQKTKLKAKELANAKPHGDLKHSKKNDHFGAKHVKDGLSTENVHLDIVASH